MKKQEIQAKRTRGHPRKKERNNDIVFQRYVLNKTLQQIGDLHGITKVAVMGILRTELLKYRHEYSNIKLPELSTA